ncbi:glutaredoxin [Meredithblackwellia eburnea MCA 4105]
MSTFKVLRTAARTLASGSSRPSIPAFLASPRAASILSRQLSSEAKAKIDDVIKENKVVLFMKGTPDLPQCGFSRAVCQVLEFQGVKEFASFNCLADPELREGIKEYSSWPTIPQLYVGGEFIGGCDIVVGMHQDGTLEKLLVDEGVLEPIPEAPAPAASV